MTKLLSPCVALAANFLSGLLFPVFAEEPLREALTRGEASVDLRYRFERVDQDGFSRNAEASTLRLRLGYTTGTYHGFLVSADFEETTVIGAELYNSTSNGLAEFPVVADPKDTEINQAYLGFTGLKGTTFKLGRQRIALDNHRFVGNVGWRQNEQTFDAFSVRADVTEKISFFYSHINNANRVFGESNPTPALANLNLFADLANVSLQFQVGTLTAYVYLLEMEDSPASSHRNVGLRFSGRHPLSDRFKLLYTAEYTDQSDYEDGAPTNSATYQFIELGMGAESFSAKLGYEELGGDGTYGFSTPLATLHAFNGWADKFLATPLAGLKDLYLSVAADLWGFKLAGVYHVFGADQGGADYGSELDVLVSRTFKKIYSANIKYASYDADTFSADTDKLWITLRLKL